MLLLHPSSTLCPHHACEVKGRNVRPPVGIPGKLQLPKLPMGGEVSRSPDKALQSLGHHVGTAQQPVDLRPVLQADRAEPTGSALLD